MANIRVITEKLWDNRPFICLGWDCLYPQFIRVSQLYSALDSAKHDGEDRLYILIQE